MNVGTRAAYPVGTPLSHYVLQEQQRAGSVSGEFSRLIHHLVLGAKVVGKFVAHAGLAEMLGDDGGANSSGDAQKKLDVLAHERLSEHLLSSGLVAAIASEESAHAVAANADVAAGARYVVAFDPLDGSSNIDCNGSIGTIFSIFRCASPSGEIDDPDTLFLRPGREQVAAGYFLFGPSTALVLSTGNGVALFTLDPMVGEFFLTEDNIHVPVRGKYYALNEGNRQKWLTWTREYADWMHTGEATGSPYSQRYVGTLVADAHRTLLYGGIFAYPEDRKNPHGKLRLLYEAMPMAFLFEQAGGAATDGETGILDREIRALHQRTPLMLGSREDVGDLHMFTEGRATPWV